MKRQVCAAAMLACACSSAWSIDLVQSYDKARRADPGILAADEGLVAGREKAVQGKALLRPQIGLSASYTHLEDRSKTSLPPELAALAGSGSGQVHQVALQLKQPIYDPRSRAEKKQLEEQTGLAEVKHRDAEQTLMQRVSEAYFGVLLAQEQVRVVQAEKAAVGLHRERAQARFEVGRGKITDVQEAQARYDTVLTKEVSASSTLAQRQASYEALTGVAPQDLAPLRGGFKPSAPQPDSAQAWQTKAQDTNSRVLVRRHELAIAGAEIGKYKLESRPTLELVAGVTQRGQSGGLSQLTAADDRRSTSIGLQLSVPLYTGGALSSKERESVARKREAEQEVAAAQRDARLQAQDAFLAVKTGVARIASLEQSVLSARTALEATTLGRDVGTRTEPDVLDAQQRFFAAELDLVQARTDYLLGRVKLALAAGELQASDLQALNDELAQ